MEKSIAQLFNALGYVGDMPTPSAASGASGVQSAYNRPGAGTGWKDVATARQQHDWTLADAWVNGQITQGIKPLFLMGFTPAWATAKAPAMAHAPDNINDWYLFCWSMASHFKGRVPVYEIWSEFDTTDCWQDAPEQMAAMWAQANAAISACDPAAKVVYGSIQSLATGGNGLAALARALGALKWPPPAISVHIYPTLDQIKLVPQWLAWVRGVLVAAGFGNTPIWVTEMGVRGFSALTPGRQINTIRTLMQMCEDAGVTSAIWYAFEHTDFGFKDLEARRLNLECGGELTA